MTGDQGEVDKGLAYLKRVHIVDILAVPPFNF
jgi:hypothetical protein